MGHLESAGYEVEALDLNIKFEHYFFKKRNVQLCVDNIFKIYEKIKDSKSDFDIQRKADCEEFLKNTTKEQIKLKLNYLNFSMNNLRKKKNFTNFFLLQQSIKTYSLFKKIYSTGWLSGHNRGQKYDNYATLLNESEFNIFIPFFEEQAKKIIEKNYHYIGFSVNSFVQTIAALTLSKILKEKGYKGIVAIGGTDIYQIKEYIKLDKSMFDKYFDIVIVGKGEETTRKIFEFIEGKINLLQIDNIIFKNEKNEIISTPEIYSNFTKKSIAIYNGYDFNDYLVPEPVLPIRATVGCYWGKCTFCDYNHGGIFSSRPVREVIEEIKFLKEKYGVENFYFVDAALPPNFLIEFSDILIKENIEIYYSTNLRFEKVYTTTLLDKLYQSGLRCCAWGLESGSEKILKDMNKGIDLKIAKKILKKSKNLGMHNHIYYIYNFPTETKKDAIKTYQFIKANKKYIFSVANHNFSLLKNSYIYQHPEKFGIDKEKLEAKEKDYYFSDEEICNKNSSEIKKIITKIDNELGSHYIKASFEIYTLIAKYNNNKNLKTKYLLDKYKLIFYKLIK